MLITSLLIISIVLLSTSLYLIHKDNRMSLLDNKDYDFLIDNNFYYIRLNKNLAMKNYVNWDQYEN